MTPMRSLLSEDPISFNELLDLFSSYVLTIRAPISKAHDMLREEIGMGENEALGYIFGVADDAELMAKRLCQIRTARNTGSDVAITLTQIEWRQLDTALPDVIDLLGDTVQTLDLLSGGFDAGGIDPDQPAIAATLRLLSRALRGADTIEIPALKQIDRKLRVSVAACREAERQAAIHMEDAE